MSTGSTSTFFIKWVNIVTMILAIAVVILGVWDSTHNDGCKRSLAAPILALGFIVFAISIIGFLGVEKRNRTLLSIYLTLLLTVLILILFFTIFAFVVTSHGSGHASPALRYKEYQLGDYSRYFLTVLNNPYNWKKSKTCLIESEDCNNLAMKYTTMEELNSAALTSIEAGCCYPPSECGYVAMNGSYHDLTSNAKSSNKDCNVYKNSPEIRCYDCDSCKAGVAQYMKEEWRLVADFTVALFIILIVICCVGCYARKKTAHTHYSSDPHKEVS